MATAKKPAAKKPAAKKAAAKKPAAKAPAKKAAPKAAKAAAPNVTPSAMKPITKPLTKSGLVAHLAEAAAVEVKAVKAVLANFEATILASLGKKGARMFTWPGLLKATAVTVPARPARKGINPFTKQEQMFAAKPASTRIRVRMLKKAQDAVK
ncbi:MAG TPA: HU family DNA-binding protein [Burkholderiaceae bacterium]|nr:HU family DNA-binding protein [Burkholderiaceae bacterium]